MTMRDNFLDISLRVAAGDAELIERFGDALKASEGDKDRLFGEYGSFALTWLMAEGWAHAGFQSVVMPHRFAAAMMATDPPEVEMPAPWPCFEVRVPNNLLVHDRDQVVSVVGLVKHGSVFLEILWERMHSGMRFPVNDFRGSDLGCCDDAPEDAARVLILARRLFVGVCFAICTHRESGPASDFALRTRERPAGGVTTSEITTGKPLTLDCIRDIRDFVAGRRATAPKVTTLVRGHWRQQAHGPAHSLRRLLWIQPFYRGHGPLLVRHARLGFSQAEAQP